MNYLMKIIWKMFYKGLLIQMNYWIKLLVYKIMIISIRMNKNMKKIILLKNHHILTIITNKYKWNK